MSIVDALNITIDDRDPQAIFDAMLSRWLELTPNAVVRDGSPEVTLLQAGAVAHADAIYAADRLIGPLAEIVLSMIGIPRDAGQPAAGIVTITFDGEQSGVIAAGTAMTANGLDLTVATDTTYADASTVAVPVRCVDTGSAGNALAAGTTVTLDDSVAYAAAASITTAFAGGSDTETDAAYLARAGNVLARLTSALSLPEHVAAYLLEDIRVSRATAISLWDGEDPATIGNDLSHMTAIAYGSAGALSSEVLDELRNAMQQIISASYTVHVITATIVSQPIELTVHAESGVDASELADAVEAALTAWLSPEHWTFGEPIRVNEIIAKASAVVGVDYVTTVETPSADVALDAYELAEAGAITVAVA